MSIASWRSFLCVALLWLTATTPAWSRPQALAKGEKYALLVGVRTFDPNEFRPLAYSEADVADLSKVLLANGYRPENVIVMSQAVAVDNFRLAPATSSLRWAARRSTTRRPSTMRSSSSSRGRRSP
jgi:hypothetical protein